MFILLYCTGIDTIHIPKMALFLAVLGGAAAVEIHRAITGPTNAHGKGKKNIELLKQRERELKQQLQEIQQELEKSKEMKDISDAERERLEALCASLKEDLSRAEMEHSAVSSRAQELEDTVKRIQEREEILERCVESLKLENSMLIQQFERLKMKHEEETAAFEQQMKELQKRVSDVLNSFAHGKINVKDMNEALQRLGVEFVCPEGQTLAIVNESLEKAVTVKERKNAVQKLDIRIDEKNPMWIQNIHLTSSPTRAAKLFLGGQQIATRDIALSMEKKQTSNVTEISSHDDTIAAVHDPSTDKKKGRAFVKKNTKKVAQTKQPLIEFQLPLSGSNSPVDQQEYANLS